MSSTIDDIKEVARSYICELRWLESDELNNDDKLVSTGVIDSLDLMQLVAHMEKAFDVTISPGDLTSDNWDTIDRICDFMRAKMI